MCPTHSTAAFVCSVFATTCLVDPWVPKVDTFQVGILYCGVERCRHEYRTGDPARPSKIHHNSSSVVVSPKGAIVLSPGLPCFPLALTGINSTCFKVTHRKTKCDCRELEDDGSGLGSTLPYFFRIHTDVDAALCTTTRVLFTRTAVKGIQAANTQTTRMFLQP